MTTLRVTSLLSLFALAVSAPACGGAKSTTSPDGAISADIAVLPITFGDDSATQKVREQCQLESKLTHFIEANGGGQAAAADPGSGRVLSVQIIDSSREGGGTMTGVKFVTVRGELRENGAVIGSFEGRRTTTGGASFGGFGKSTCSMLGRDVKALGRDIAEWTAAPTMNARIGE